jgi:hypothetical protein
MMLRRAFEPGEGSVPIDDFREEANLHLLSQREIFRIGGPRMGYILLDPWR